MSFLEVEVERILPGGYGLAHSAGHTIFVALAAPGDRLRVRVDRQQGNVLFASIEEILVASPDRIAIRFGEAHAQVQRLLCTCAPVHDYTGRQVARVGVFTHAADEQPFALDQTGASMDLARRISLRLGHLPASLALGA